MKLLHLNEIPEKEQLPDAELSGIVFTHYYDNNSNTWCKTGVNPEEYAKVVYLTHEFFAAYNTLHSHTATIFKGYIPK